MPLNFITLASFYAPARNAVQYAATLAQAMRGSVVLLHANRAAMFDLYDLAGPAGEQYRKAELAAQADTAAGLRRQAENLHVPATVEIAVDLLPAVAQDLAARYHPALFVVGRSETDHPDYASVTTECGDLLRAAHFPVLLVPPTVPTDRVPHRFVIAADGEAFALGPHAQPLRELLAMLGNEVVVAHVSDGVEDNEACGAALRTVQASGLTGTLATPEVRGYTHVDNCEGILAAVAEARADMVVVLARQRSYLGDLFHRSVTARLLEFCPVPVLVLPTAPEAPATPTEAAESGQYVSQVANALLSGLSPAR